MSDKKPTNQTEDDMSTETIIEPGGNSNIAPGLNPEAIEKDEGADIKKGPGPIVVKTKGPMPTGI
jgi:hypothetical protein